MKKREIVKKSIKGNRGNAGTAYVIIPIDVDRDEYIVQCYRTGTISICIENNGEYVHNVRIGKLALQIIDFPDSKEELGSLVGWVNHEGYNFPMVFDVLTKGDEGVEIDEKELTLKKQNDTSSSSITLKNGEIIISAESDDTGGLLCISVTNGGKTAKFDLEIGGNMNVYVEKEIVIKTLENIAITAKDVVGDIKRLIIGVFEKTEAVAKAEALKKELETERSRLDSVIQAFTTAPITVGDGGAAFKTGLINATSSLPKADYSNISSERIFTE